MNKTKLIYALLLPALMAACSDDVFDGGTTGKADEGVALRDVTLYVGLENGATTRGTFAGSDEKGLLDKFYFQPDFTGGSGSDLKETSNSELAGDVVGLCFPNPTDNGEVVTNVPFYIAGYQAVPQKNGSANKPFSLDSESENDFYKISEDQQEDAAFEESGTKKTTKNKFDAEVTNLKGEYAPKEGKADITKAIFKSVSGLMTGNYVLYYPYNKTFTDMTKIPAVPLKTIATQTTVAPKATATSDHVLGADAFFAYSKKPFKVDGKQNAAMEMDMTPAAYFFQFKIYTSAAEKMTGDDAKIKLLTVTTSDEAAAFAKEGYVKAGVTNTFEANAETAVDMIGVNFTGVTEIPAATTENKNDNALSVYLSAYPVTSELAGKDIVVRLYTENGKVYTVTKAGVGSRIVEGGTDYWNIDLKGVKAEDAERLVFSNETLTEELSKEAGTLVLKNDIELKAGATIAKEFTIKGGNYKLIVPGEQTLNVNANCDFQCTVENKGTIKFGGNKTKSLPREVKMTTLNNEGTVTVPLDGILRVTALNNMAKGKVEVKVTPGVTYVSGEIYATTLNNKGTADIEGFAYDTTIENDGELTVGPETVTSRLTVNNRGNMTIGKASKTTVLSATVVNDGTVTIPTGAVVNAKGARITNNKEMMNNGTLTLLGETAFTNNGKISDLGVFSGLSRLTNNEGATMVKAVAGYTNLVPALAETKLTGIRITADIPEDSQDIVVNTDKIIYLGANLTLDTTKPSAIGSIVFEGNHTLTGNITTSAITVEKGDANIGAKSNVTVNGIITVNEKASLTGADDSYTICDDIKGKGSVSGQILVR